MKIVKTDGCVVSGIDIDGIDINNISEEIKQKVIKYVSDQMNTDPGYFREVLSDIVTTFGEYKYLYTCEQCGDSVSETTLEI